MTTNDLITDLDALTHELRRDRSGKRGFMPGVSL